MVALTAAAAAAEWTGAQSGNETLHCSFLRLKA
jgi:hypothetical protein